MVEVVDDSQLAAGGVERAAAAVRSLIVARRLLPGEQLRQDELARRLGLSRSTLREALQALSVERMVTYTRNRGYTVARFGAEEMQQLYQLRDFSEKLLLESISAPSEEEFATLVELNERIRAAAEDPREVVRLNDEFHLKIFDYSPLRILAEETRRWWTMSAAYRALSVTTLQDRSLIAADHDGMLEALRIGDSDLLVQRAYKHRHASLDRIIPTII
ncbi:GntR family transcriptional regulator [Rhodococcus sp. NCIMB 12038]|uniref:GntR family transcriptional regulator n=1 Tax=Rhodococcus sp. NCIMB 12038 TaxID=933800 RepID=UPI000B3D34E9|nr:GntR family transcriptional regulator [Rhodococcus sp. NCIMB 12038]OUS92117.1 hypothetical protein CA951_29860 [Rhodococcus sp. NCIMB 12038]